MGIAMNLDWLDLWRELVLSTSTSAGQKSESLRNRYIEHARKQSERFDPLLDFVLKNVDSQTTILDIGAGNGRWTIPLAQNGKEVTAVEPSSAMRELLDKNIGAANLNNVQVVQSSWDQASVDPHDIVVCAHAMYGSPDFATFVRKIEQHTRKSCYLAVRLPPSDGILGQLSLAIKGRSHDSPNAIVAYNALYGLGIYANVLVENDIYRWESKTYQDAFVKVKRHLHVESDKYDGLIRETLSKSLIPSDNYLIWPDGMRSALLWWKPDKKKL
jgi:SAM-dependent methyltransferase